MKGSRSDGHTNIQVATDVPVVKRKANTVTPKSGPTMTLPSQKNWCVPGHTCHTLSACVDDDAAAMCSGTTEAMAAQWKEAARRGSVRLTANAP